MEGGGERVEDPFHGQANEEIHDKQVRTHPSVLLPGNTGGRATRRYEPCLFGFVDYTYVRRQHVVALEHDRV